MENGNNQGKNPGSKERKSNRQRAAEEAYQPDYTPPPRRPNEERPGAFNPLAWVVEGVTGVIEEVRHNDLGLSKEFWVHLYALRRESLLTARALIDSLLDQSESEQNQAQDRQKRRERRGGVDIEF